MSARERIAGNVANYVDERTGAAAWMKKNLQKVFPDHWSFMLGEIALYSFVILLTSICNGSSSKPYSVDISGC